MMFRYLSILFLCAVVVGGSAVQETIQTQQGECVNEECLNEADVSDDGDCTDNHQNCPLWASQGKCDSTKQYMETYCQKSCGICGTDNNSTKTIDIGVTQIIDAERAKEIEQRIADAQDYVANVVAKDDKLNPLLELCKNNHESCAFWAVIGECEKNPGYMKTKCAPVCRSCDQLSIETRCPIDLEKMPNIWEKGDVNKFFYNLTTLPENQKYGIKVLSRPDYLPGDTKETADYKGNGPWAVLLENFISDEEATSDSPATGSRQQPGNQEEKRLPKP
jgi:hypothetical protein